MMISQWNVLTSLIQVAVAAGVEPANPILEVRTQSIVVLLWVG